ncbi:SANT/Myb domain [Sesbania bispinosa]|nr:SANT/Myb domain [Sesbania bispinosa]
MEQVKEESDAGIKGETLVSSFAEPESSCAKPQAGVRIVPGNRRYTRGYLWRMTGPTRRSTKGGWTEQEDKWLIAAVKTYNGKNWKKIAEYVPTRTDVQCLHRWQKVLNPDLIKGPWTKQVQIKVYIHLMAIKGREDDLIRELVMIKGKKSWSEISKFLPGRIGKQCRERWHNHLNPDIKRTAWTKEEELILVKAHQMYGNRWAEIAKFLHGRSENSIKNHWNCSMKKKVNLDASLRLPQYNLNLNFEEGKMSIVKQSSEEKEKVNLDQRSKSNLGIGIIYARENHAQSMNSETSIHVRNEAGCFTKPQSTSALNQTSNESCKAASPVRFEANVNRGSIEPLQNKDNTCVSSLCYKPLQLKDLDILLGTGRKPSTDNYLQKNSNPNALYITPPNYTKRMFDDSPSPADILRSAARSFKDTPSIIRKERTKLSKKNTSSIQFSKGDVRFNCTTSPRRLDFSPCEKS